MRLALVSDLYTNHSTIPPGFSIEGVDDVLRIVPSQQPPTPEEVVGLDYLMIFGPLQNADLATAVAGVADLALESGTTVVFAYGVRTNPEAEPLLARLGSREISAIPTGQQVAERDSVFHDYFTAFGRCAVYWRELPTDTTVLGTIDADGDAMPCAYVRIRDNAAFYVVPYHVMGSHAALVRSLLRTIIRHRSGDALSIPAFLADARLSGEQAILDEVDALREQLESTERRAGYLEDFRLMVGPASGTRFEELVIDALSEVLKPTEFRAEDRDELHAEDFWIVRGEQDFALAEVKGLGSNVRREHLNQVDNHRSELNRAIEDLPGLLVVNTFRNAEDLAGKSIPLHDDTVRHACRLNVTVLRGWDLYHLLSRALAGDDAAQDLLSLLSGGGGWLEVDASGATPHNRSS